MIPRKRLRPRERGFTLVELALVMGIVALLLGGLMVPVARMLEQKANATTQAALETAQQALLGFALLNQRLPCPAVGSDGVAGTYDAVNSKCPIPPPPMPTAIFSDPTDASWGDLPWATLGVSGADAWGNRLRYAVSTPLASTSALTATNLTNSKLTVTCTTQTSTNIPSCFSAASPLIPTNNAAFVVYSHGKNSRGAVSMDGSTNFSAPPANSDELQNFPNSNALGSTAASRRTFVFRFHTDAVNPAGEFDDLMAWIPGSLLAAKLLTAGQWKP
jgi:prepilin-type N-terminal cleavage/methylation domain-containing protein